MIDISIITLNYNNSQLTKEFVDSVIKCTSSSITYEIIIVDNRSESEDYNNLCQIIDRSEATIIRGNINTGFGAGNMFGRNYASGKYLAFINNDVIFVEDCLSSLILFLKTNKNVALVTSQQVDGNNDYVYSHDYYHGLRRTFFGSIGVDLFKKIKRTKKAAPKPMPVDFLQGCLMMFDADKFDEVGGFDTNLYIYFEEMDICFRLKQKGYLSYLVPETKFKHLESATINKNYSVKKELLISRLYILRKNHNYFKYSIIRMYFLIKWIFKSLTKPKYFEMVWIIITGAYTENSLKHKQKVIFPK